MQNVWSITGRSIAVSALALALTACQSMRSPEPVAQADIPSSYTNASGTSVAEQGYKNFFADQRLLQVLDLALNNNRDLRIAALNIQRAQQQYQITENNQLPTIGASGSVLRQDTMNSQNRGAVTTYNVGLGVTAYELDFWGRVRSLRDNALDSFLATQSARDATQIALIGQVSQAWLSYSFANANLALAEQTLKAQLESFNLNKKRFDVGIDSELPVRQAQISVETARNDVANYRTQVAQAQNLLNLLVGQQVPANLLPAQRVTRITSNTALGSGLPSDLLINRPDVRAAEYRDKEDT